MSDETTYASDHGHSRRRFLGIAGSAGALGLLGAGPLTRLVDAQALTREQRDAMTPETVIDAMKQGNERFRTNKPRNRSLLDQQRITATAGQFPKAVLLSCIDSRAAAELLLDMGIGDIFNSRVAGNVCDEDILGGMEFSCDLMGAKVVLVMGHTGCGAVRGAISGVPPRLGNLTTLLEKIKPAVAATTFTGDRSADNPAFVDAVAKKHVELTVADIRKRSAVLAGLELHKEAARRIKIVGSMYNLRTGMVDFFV